MLTHLTEFKMIKCIANLSFLSVLSNKLIKYSTFCYRNITWQPRSPDFNPYEFSL